MDFLCYQAKLGLRKGWMLYAGEGDKVCSHASRVKKNKNKKSYAFAARLNNFRRFVTHM